LPISARVVALKPLRAKQVAAADKIAATRGFCQSTARGAVAFSWVSALVEGVSSIMVTVAYWTGQPTPDKLD